MNLHRLNEAGVQQFLDFLVLLRAEPTRQIPITLLTDETFSEQIEPAISINQPLFSNRYSLAAFVYEHLLQARIQDSEKDVGMWCWLALYLFDSICPANSEGARKVREVAAYIPEPANFRRYYRHLVLGPYLIYRTHSDQPERAFGLLCKAPHTIDDIVGQLAARQEFVTNPGIVELVTKLYYSPTTKTKPGAGGKGKGSPRRLSDILWQFDLTWDLYAMSVDEFVSILPKEFDRFIEA
jgi:hypothetical protein